MNRRVLEASLATTVLLILIMTNYLAQGISGVFASSWFFLAVLYFYLQWVFQPEEAIEEVGLHEWLTKLWQDLPESAFRRLEHLKLCLLETRILMILVVFLIQPAVILYGVSFLPLMECLETPPTPVDYENNLTHTLSLVLITGPLLEEYFFRGILQERMSWITSENRAIMIASIAFALAHLSPGALLCEAYTVIRSFLCSLFFGLVYSRTRSFLISWIPHLGVNSLAVIASLFLPVS